MLITFDSRQMQGEDNERGNSPEQVAFHAFMAISEDDAIDRHVLHPQQDAREFDRVLTEVVRSMPDINPSTHQIIQIMKLGESRGIGKCLEDKSKDFYGIWTELKEGDYMALVSKQLVEGEAPFWIVCVRQ